MPGEPDIFVEDFNSELSSGAPFKKNSSLNVVVDQLTPDE